MSPSSLQVWLETPLYAARGYASGAGGGLDYQTMYDDIKGPLPHLDSKSVTHWLRKLAAAIMSLAGCVCLGCWGRCA